MLKLVYVLLMVGSFNLFAGVNLDALKLVSLNSDVKINGTLVDLKSYLSSLDSGEVEFKFTVEMYDEHLTTSKKIAKFLAAALFENLSTKEPQFCGEVADGEVSEGYQTGSYVISGRGDGGHNTCTGEGYPGGWDFYVGVKYSKSSNQGLATVKFYTE